MIPCAIDQDPYFRLTRDVAARLHFAKPALLHARFLDALQGPGSKMSASVDISAIFMYDEPNKIKNKINKYAFSGGQETMEEQREKGGDTDKDVAYQYLTFFLEDDEELEKIGADYRSGKMLTGELKQKCISELQVYVKGFQERRAKVTDEIVADFFSHKKLEWKGNPNPILVAKEGSAEGTSAEGEGKLSKSQLKKIEKEKIFAQRRAEKEAAKAAAKTGGS
jgi:tryptophanyl-tRNA synthetase